MWRKLTALLFLIVLAQAANAVPNHNAFNGNSLVVNEYFQAHSSISNSQALDRSVIDNRALDNPSVEGSTPKIEQHTISLYEDDEPEHLFNLPRLIRLSPSLFLAVIQNSPNYVLEVEFFKVKLSAGQFKHLANPPETALWFEQTSHNANSSRLSGWKDGNSLYTSRITYYS